ncbi:TetR/AcrR family transcriptional regulator [Streptomyces sp. NPDC004658]|uniref:TetR/AcrR family transcriptional regulator n=1 Tax=Streptomyces sp. NPDC004658 TaxID=3154672 RepID=UPI0033B3D28F
MTGARAGLRRRSNTRTRLLDAAEELFAVRGTTAVSIDEICRQAGFTRGAFYSNFRTVDEVFFALYERQTEHLLEGMRQSPPLAMSGGGLEDVVETLMHVLPPDWQWYAIRAQFTVQTKSRPETTETLRAHGERLADGLEPFVVAAVRSAGRDLTCSPSEGTRVVIAAHVGAVLQSPLTDDPERLRRDVLLSALRGISEPVGPAPTR